MIDTDQWELPAIFALLQQGGGIAPDEMARTFNCGVGMAVIVAPDEAEAVLHSLDDGTQCDNVFRIGEVAQGQRGCTVSGPAGTWNSAESWSATHNA
jgi:phosphoribosylformylglycinamidine cyclo-ligase